MTQIFYASKDFTSSKDITLDTSELRRWLSTFETFKGLKFIILNYPKLRISQSWNWVNERFWYLFPVHVISLSCDALPQKLIQNLTNLWFKIYQHLYIYWIIKCLKNVRLKSNNVMKYFMSRFLFNIFISMNLFVKKMKWKLVNGKFHKKCKLKY